MLAVAHARADNWRGGVVGDWLREVVFDDPGGKYCCGWC